jgi:hypothetical protein
LLAAAICLGAVIALRMFPGPMRLVVSVPTAFNIEGLFGAIVTILLLTRPDGAGATAGSSAARWIAIGSVVVVVAAAVSLLPSLSVGFLSDDFSLLTKEGRDTWSSAFAAFHTPGRNGFYRPVGDLALFLDFRRAGLNAVQWHVSAILLHLLNSVLVLLLARRTGASQFASAVAGVLFAVHGIHPEVNAWSPAARFDLMATLFSIAGLWLFLESEDACGSRRQAYYGGSFLCMLLAVTSKESAYMLPVLLAMYAWQRRSNREFQFARVIPFFIGAGAVFLYRWTLFHGIGGYVVGGQSQAFTLRPASTLKAVTMRLWAALYFPVNWSAEVSFRVALAAVLYMAGLLWLVTRPAPTKLWLPFGFILLAVIPPVHLLGIGPDLFNARVIYLASVGFCILLAMSVDGLKGHTRCVAAFALIAFQTAALEHNLRLWSAASIRVRNACSVAAETAGASGAIEARALPQYLDGVPAFSHGFPECVDFAAGRPVDTRLILLSAGDGSSVRGSAEGRRILTWDPATRTLVPQ